MIRTDRGHEFQAKFHWHVEDLGIRHDYIKPRSPQLNGKVERSHRSDQEEFYQLLSYKDDVDLEAKLADWERFYNLARPHGAHNGKTPYEAFTPLIRHSVPPCQRRTSIGGARGAIHVLPRRAAIQHDRPKPMAVGSCDVHHNSCSHDENLNCFADLGIVRMICILVFTLLPRKSQLH
jgi:hypothetical protein